MAHDFRAAVYLLLMTLLAPSQAPGGFSFRHTWTGRTLINCNELKNWSVSCDAGSTGRISLTEGVDGQAVRLDWTMGSGGWSQLQYTFPQPVDLSDSDLFGASLQGGGANESAQRVGFMFADTRNTFFRYKIACDTGINPINRWMLNLALPKKLFTNEEGQAVIDWTQINRFFVYVERPPEGAGGSGRLAIDHIQSTRAADWSRQDRFKSIAAKPDETLQWAANKAIMYILSQQKPTGLLISWNGEPSPKAWLYDQALALILLTREGNFINGTPKNTSATAAKRLVNFLIYAQKADGRWARGWNPETGKEIMDDRWVGDQAWSTLALALYARKSGDDAAWNSAGRAAASLIARIDDMGKVDASTEGNVDAWWALIATCNFSPAANIQQYLTSDTVWDPDLKYWWRGYRDPVIALDVSAWMSEFSRHLCVNTPEKGLAALSLVRKTLTSVNADGTLSGMDGMGPVGIWHEGMAQYVAAGGQDSRGMLELLVSRQQEDGSMTGSPENEISCFGSLYTWKGLAPTAWLYFAITGSPFKELLEHPSPC